ncbi:MAG: chromosome segregation protein SMC, partial [Bacteroidota bacterium]
MYLSRLDLHGFKSFAQKTSVDFSPGVTAIVGPNGCGKSNVIDAVRWVLGEQRARLLRSESMGGVIFNGASGTRALGMAEVSLTVENTRGVLPTEYAEVTVTRRLFRSGDSEYLLNGTTCRLRDILDLFMDTGMGAGAYSVIELSMVEDILSDNADDRRRLFEEAAGITKYKRRRAQALRRLDATRADLTRLDDIIEEVEKQVRSLSRQAQKAARHERLATRLRRLELSMAAHDLARLQDEREQIEAALKVRGTEAEGLAAQIATGEAALEDARTTLIRLEGEMGTAARALQAHAETVQALEAEIRVGAERREAQRRALARIDKEREADAARLVAVEAEAAEADARIAAAEAEAERAEARLGEAETIRDETRAAADAKRHDLDAARQAHAEAQAALRQAESARDRARDRRAFLTAERERVEAERNALAASETETDDAPEAALAEAEAALADAQARLDAAQQARDAARDAAEAAEAARQAARLARDTARAEVALLESLVDLGTDGAVAFLAAHPDVDAPTVAEVVAADAADRLALDAALGAWADTLVVPTEDDADAAIGRLRAAEKGRATFLVLDRLGAPSEVSPTPPGTTPLLDLARPAHKRYAPLLRSLFANTFVAESLVAARDLRGRFPAARFVTREGAWTDARGAVRGGSAQPSATADRLGAAERHAQAAETLAAAEDALAEAEAVAETARATRSGADATRTEAEDARDAARDVRDEARTAVARAQARTAARDEQAVRLDARLGSLAADLGALDDDDTLDGVVSDRAGAVAGTEAARQTTEASFQSADRARAEAEGAWSDARLAQARTQLAAQAAREARARAERSRDEIAARQAARDDEQARLQADLDAASGTEADAQGRLDAMRGETDALVTAAAEAETAVLQGRAAIADAETALREVRSSRETAQTARAEADRRLAEIATRQETTLERLAEEHSADLDEATAELDRLQAEELFQPDTARIEIPSLRQKIRDLGAVNALALESYEEEKTRLAFLHEQRADLQGAEDTLLDTIREINETARRRFDETFGQVREAFRTLFNDLFGGDAQADIALDGDDPLEAPVSITARPKGKRPVSLTQLSGGEKTLTATALLFAIYLVKPSPFCILDEVDAPLDDANVGRFMNLIRSFADSTQFILVTHNKLTMEAADR